MKTAYVPVWIDDDNYEGCITLCGYKNRAASRLECYDNHSSETAKIVLPPADIRELRKTLQAREDELVRAGYLEAEEEKNV